MWLHSNKLSGSLPRSLGEMTNLRDLRLNNNPLLSGEIPDSLYDLRWLEHLDLGSCSFDGTLSSRIGELGESLTSLRLSNNNFHGQIPAELDLLNSLIVMR